MFPKKGQFIRVLGFGYKTFRRRCVPLLKELATTMDEVHWADRLHPMNHTANFPFFVTHIVDTTFVKIAEPSHGRFRGAFNSGKYHATGLKLEVSCNFMGHIVDFQFPAGLGITNDNTIWNRRLADGTKVLEPWEYGMGDGIYRGCPQMIAKYPLNFNQIYHPVLRRYIHVPLTDVQTTANETISEKRQGIEHIVYLCTSKHQLFLQAYQGEYEPLVHAVHIAVHLANVQIKMSSANGTAANGYSRYTDITGPWNHDGI